MEWERERGPAKMSNGDLALWVQGDTEIVGGEEAGALDATVVGRKDLTCPKVASEIPGCL